jgi:sorbitol-6-phosphate 2-dehydrogenase
MTSPISNRVSLINTVAPALRAVLAESNTLAMVRFEDSATAEAHAAVFQVSPEESAHATVARLQELVADHRARHGRSPGSVLIPGLGVFSAGRRGEGRTGRVAGKIAVVTGAAQGFGLEIAQQFAAEGGTVVLTDLNEAGARRAAMDLCEQHGRERALGLAIDVTRPESIAACVHQVVRCWGGFDVFISNAGVLKADSVKTQTEQDFDLVTAVNYRGYFFCVQNAAPILGIQHQARPSYWSDIIQINSKSGLQGSNKNGAYAGSKFGGLGLTQSFALELIGDGIKVNSICPGNFFDGPLWSDPEDGLFVQYLRTGKVPGATSIADVRRFYEAKVPMGRGCTTADVMQAVFYVVDQRYETGQAVPVTGGQVMLS